MKTSELECAALDRVVAELERKYYDDRGFLFMTGDGSFEPSTRWAQGGPIIEREWSAICAQVIKWKVNGANVPDKPLLQYWMRCYVASKLGEEVEVPEELR